MTKEELKRRTKDFAIGIIKLIDVIPATKAGHVISNQMLRSATSIGANYRAACRAKSDKDFLNKLVIVEEEADETCYWLELLIEAEILKSEKIDSLLAEGNELTAIFTSSGRTVRNRLNNNS